MLVDLGCAADSGSTRLADVLPRDRDRRGDALDALGFGLVKLLQELAGVGRKALDVPSLPLSVQRVQRETRLATAADAAEGDQLSVRQIQVDAAEIVYGNAPETNYRGGGGQCHRGGHEAKHSTGSLRQWPRVSSYCRLDWLHQ